MEKLQEEIIAQLVVLEYANTQLECNAADERAKLLASEVVGLEEKLEKQFENSCEEISAYKKKVSSLEKESQDLQSTLSALQEEKKLLQSKVWKASSSVSGIDMNQIGIKRKEMSTSTEDLGDAFVSQALGENIVEETYQFGQMESLFEIKDYIYFEESWKKFGLAEVYHDINGVDQIKWNFLSTNPNSVKSSHFSNTDSEQAVDARLVYGSVASSSFFSGGAGLNLEAASVFIPTDHTRIIVNINTLISELAFEKNEILKALESEKVDNIKLKGLNIELSRKLETQTQRLELLTSQSMVTENIPSRLRDVPTSLENAPYADQGDEVLWDSV